MMMKMLTRNIAFLLIVLLLLPYNVIASTEDTGNAIQTNEFQTIHALGFIDNRMTALKPDDTLTRAQYTSMVGAILGFTGIQLKTGGFRFMDVSEDYWCSSSIYMLKEMGIIGGKNYYQFDPEGKITYAQAVKVIVSALGYQVQAESRYGGYPTGYFTIANSLKILGGSKSNADGYLTMKDAAAILYRALTVDILKENSIGDQVEYQVVDGETLLSVYHDIYYAKGIVTDNGVTALSGESVVGKKRAVIGGIKVNDENNLSLRYLGYYVGMFYKENDADYNLVYISPLEKTKTLVIRADDLDTEDGNFKVNNIVYYDGDEKEDARIDDFADLIYNNKAYPAYGVANYKIQSGTLTLIDNDSDNVYEVIFVEEYHNTVALSYDADMNKVFGKYGGDLALDVYKTIHVYDVSGKDSSLSAIKSNHILSYAESMDKSQITIYISAQTVEGTVNGINDDDNLLNGEYIVGDKTYLLSEEFINAIEAVKVDAEKPKLNTTYIFYLDKDGKIAALKKSASTEEQYAYLIGVDYKESLALFDTASVRLFMPNGEIFDAFTAKKIKINGVSDLTGKDLAKDARLYNDAGKIKHQIVKIKLNSLGDILEFYFAESPLAGYGYHPNTFTLNYSASNAAYKGNNQRCFDGRYSISDKTTIFSVPAEEDFSVDDIEIIKATNLTDGKNYSVQFYDADATLVAKVAVIVTGGSASSYDTSLFTVDKVSTTINKKGETAKRVYGVCYGNYVSYTEKKEGILPEGLKQGDVGRIAISNTELSNFQLLTSLADKPEPVITALEGAFVGGQFVTIFGYLYGKSDTAISTLNPEGSSDKLSAHVLNGSAAKVTVYDAASKKVRVGSLAEVVPNRLPDQNGNLTITDDSVMVYIYRRMDYVREVVIVKY